MSATITPFQISRLQSFLDTGAMLKNPVHTFKDYIEQGGNHTFRFYFGGIKPAIVTTHAGIIQHFLKTNAGNYQKSDIQVKRMAHFLGKGLLTSHGKEWLNKRRLIQKGFHKNRLSSLIKIMQQDFDETVTNLKWGKDEAPLDVYKQMMHLTFSMVTRALFSISLPKEELETISNSILTVQQFMVKQIVQPYLNPWFGISGQLRYHEDLKAGSDNIIRKYIKQRRQSGENREDMLQIFFEATYEDSGLTLDDEEVLHESIQLLVAGHETSSNALSWICYLLCKHPEAMQKVRDEVNTVIGERLLSYEDLPKLSYCTQVIEEALRLYPPFWMVDRVALKQDCAEGLNINPGDTIIAFIYGLHHSENYWENAEDFNPDRFNPLTPAKSKSTAYMPFGTGPRGCIGGNFAMMQMLLIIVNIARCYHLQLVPDKEVPIAPMLILRPEGGIHIRFRSFS